MMMFFCLDYPVRVEGESHGCHNYLLAVFATNRCFICVIANAAVIFYAIVKGIVVRVRAVFFLRVIFRSVMVLLLVGGHIFSTQNR